MKFLRTSIDILLALCLCSALDAQTGPAKGKDTEVIEAAAFQAALAVNGTPLPEPAVTGYTGGGPTKLDGLETTGLPEGTMRVIFVSDREHLYELKAATAEEAIPTAIRPDDYNGSTNVKVWLLRGRYGLSADIADASVGGGGILDAGRLVKFGANGNLLCASGDGAVGLNVTCSKAGAFGVEASTNYPGNRAFSCHLFNDQQVGFSVDGEFSGPHTVGYEAVMADGFIMVGGTNFEDRMAVMPNGSIRFTPNGGRNDTKRINLSGPVATGLRDYRFADAPTTEPLSVVGVITKTTTGNPGSGYEGQQCINTFDNTLKVYADGEWRTITTW